MGNLNERLDRLRDYIQKSDFLEGKGLSNEVNIQIFCYDAEDEMAVRHFTRQLMEDQTLNCHLIEYDLYKIFLSLCDDMGITEEIPNVEEEDGSDYLLEQLHGSIGEGEFIEKMMYSPHERGDVILITGVGDVFPFMRVHTLLESMQVDFSDVPILVMYPGKFDKLHLKLFDRLKPNDYYRAFNVIE